MKFLSLASIIVFLICGCKSQMDLRNKYLVYSKMTNENDGFYADFFIVNLSDSVFFVQNEFGIIHDTGTFINTLTNDTSKDVLGLRNELAYKVIKRKDGIYYLFFNCKNRNQIKWYSSSIDTVRIKKDQNNINVRIFTVNTGIDTTIIFYNNKLQCKKFLEINLDHFPDPIITETYFEKRSFLPVLIKRPEATRRGPIKYQTYILRHYVDRSEVKSIEWRN